MTVEASRRSPSAFIVLVFALAVPWWVLGYVTDEGLPLPMSLPLSALQAFCPLVAALLLMYRAERLTGVKALLRRLVDVRRISRKLWLVPILLLVPAIYVVSYWAMRLMGRPLPEPRIPVLAVPVLFLVFLVAAAGEEAGWTGYLTEPLLRRWGALTSAVAIGSAWGLFHIVADIQIHRSADWIVWQRAVYDVTLRIVIVWLYNRVGRSLSAAILVHASDNVSVSLFPNAGSHYDPAVTGVITAIIALVLTVWGAKDGTDSAPDGHRARPGRRSGPRQTT